MARLPGHAHRAELIYPWAMAFLGFGRTELPYEMFDASRSAAEAKRFAKCANIYHKGQDMAWDGREILQMLVDEHGTPDVPPAKLEALKRLFSIIMWGEMAAWKISLQLADRLEPLEARMAATSQAHDEARHFYVMYDYLQLIGYTPAPMDRAPQALLDHVLQTNVLAHKLLGMQLLVETIALAIFQEVREQKVEPVLAGLMAYFERDEARHVGLGVQYLPQLMKEMSPFAMSRLFLFQAQLVCLALWENKVIEQDFIALGIDQRRILDRARDKQTVAMTRAFEALGWEPEDGRSVVFSTISAVIELAFPPEENRGSRSKRFVAAKRAFSELYQPDARALEVHGKHRIKTTRGYVE